jgi:hypothetical protein
MRHATRIAGSQKATGPVLLMPAEEGSAIKALRLIWKVMHGSALFTGNPEVIGQFPIGRPSGRNRHFQRLHCCGGIASKGAGVQRRLRQ